MHKVIHIVDSDPSVRGATSFLLSSHGFSPRIYEGGTEFLEQADLGEGCALLDLRMSDMSGLEVLEALKEAGSGVPVIMLTGHGDIATAVQALKLGAVDFIQKPYDEGDLIAAIERALASGGCDSRRRESKRAALERLERLSAREKQVLRGLLGGMTNKEMARLLDLSPRTVEMHRSTMMADLGIDAAAEGIRIAIAADLSPLNESKAQITSRPPPSSPRSTLALPQPRASRALCEILPRGRDVLEASTDCDRVVASDHATGAAIRMVGITDIPARKSMKRIAADSNARLAMAQECAGAGLWDYDVRTGALRLCARSRAMFGLADGTGRLDVADWKTAIHRDDLAATLMAFDRAVRTGEPYSARYRVVLPNGDLRSIHGAGKAAGRVDGNIVRMIGLNLDETEEALAIEKLGRLQADLLDIACANAVGTMAVALADELNQPLTAILNYVQGLKLAFVRSVPGESADLPDVLNRTEACAREATSILRRIRRKASINRLRQRPERLSAMIGDAARVALAGSTSGGVRLTVSVAPEADRVMIDRAQIQQVIINLVRNAAEAMKEVEVEGEREIAIRGAIGARGKVEVTIEDCGGGVPDEIVGQLFLPFVSAKEQNAGIGLTVSRTIVEAHGGRIWAVPAPGGGTSIGFTLEPAREHESHLYDQAA